MSAPTASQHQAITACGNVLVVAGAGTGKTRTLVERALRLVLEEDASLNRMLLVTFTEAAAAEMRQRIRDALLARLQARPDQARLAEQVALLDTAFICTLHSFCLRLVREHACALGIDPEVTVLDSTQTQPLMAEALDTVLARQFEPGAPRGEAVRDLIRRYGRGSEDRIRRLLVQLHRYSQVQPDPEGWWEKQMAYFKAPEPTQWRQWLVEGVQEWCQLWVEFLEAQPPGNINAHRCKEVLAKYLAAGRNRSAPVQSLDAMATLVSNLAAVDQPDNWPRGTKKKFREPIAGLFEEAAFLESLLEAGGGSDPLQQDWDWVREPMRTLLRLGQEFSAAFAQAKRELGGVDFADLEQMALRLLVDRQTGRPTALARSWQQRLHYIFVDEYQDINPAQDAILTALSRSGAAANRFMVGDLKQSIYRFRLANPRIICRYEAEWRQSSPNAQCVALTDNFRSRESLLDFVNALFGALMRPELGGAVYGPEAQLRFGDPARRAPLARTGSGPAPAGPCVELHLLIRAEEPEEGSSPDEASQAVLDLTGTEREARLVALRLRQLKQEGYPVWDPVQRAFRPVAWRDMAVLLRAPADKAEAYAQEFHRAGVPIQAARGGFLESQEVMDLHSLLQVLDNPLQDVPLLAVLRSPLVGLSLDELVHIGAHRRQTRFWEALRRFHQEARPTTPAPPHQGQANAWAKVDQFLRRFEVWRELVRLSSLSDCLERVLEQTHYEALLQLGPRGPERVANVRRFVDLARRYDPYQRQGLFRFLAFLAAQQEAEQDLEPAAWPAHDSVTLTSIHKSKGLEFPVVAVADLGKRFNLGSLIGDVLLSEDYGLAPMVCPPGDRPRYPSLPCWLARRRERRELLSEELRLLYVACTRARDRLILTGQAGRRAGQASWPGGPPQPIPTAELLKATSHLDWLRPWLAQVVPPDDWQSSAMGQSALLRWRRWREDDPELAAEPAGAPAPSAASGEPRSEETAAQLIERLTWRYPLAAATRTRAKASVTELRRWAAEPDEESDQWFGAPTLKGPEPPQTVALLGPEAALSPEQRGTAFHTLLQFVRLDCTSTATALRQEARRLEQEGFLSAAEVAVLDFEALARFWTSPLGQRIRANPNAVRRELEFTAGLSPGDLARLGVPVEAGLAEDELIVVQGVVDLAVFEPDHLWLVDFKTDAVTEATLPDKVAAYRPQLQLYGLALERVHRRPVRERWLHFLTTGQSVQV